MNAMIVENGSMPLLDQQRELVKAVNIFSENLNLLFKEMIKLINEALERFNNLINELYKTDREQKKRNIITSIKRKIKHQETRNIKDTILDMLFSVRKNKPPNIKE